MIREAPTREWGSFLEHCGREHRAWLATVHVLDARRGVNSCVLRFEPPPDRRNSMDSLPAS